MVLSFVKCKKKNESDALFFYADYIIRIRYLIAIKIEFWPLHSCFNEIDTPNVSVIVFGNLYTSSLLADNPLFSIYPHREDKKHVEFSEFRS